MLKDRFGKALEKGLAAAEEADANQQEIEQAIKSVGRSILASTSNLVSVYSEMTPVDRGISITGAIGDALGQPDVPRAKTFGIFATVKHGEASDRERLCLITLSKMSLPVQVQWAGETRMCNTVESLLGALEAVLENPSTGKKLRSLLAWHERAVKTSVESAKDGPDGD